MRVHVLGGFLGAGKTTAMRALAKHLQTAGEQVAMITNDQGHILVDTALCETESSLVSEIGGGCFCCRYDRLENALTGAREAGATVALAEAVGSCTDLVATVIAPLTLLAGDRFEPAPLSILVDPWRVREIESGVFPDDIGYLFRKQIEEADVIVLTRADLEPPDVTDFIHGVRPDVPIIAISSLTGHGIEQWMATEPETLAAPLEIDYERYARAEAALGWLNGRVRLHSTVPFAPREVVERFLAELSEESIAHLKLKVENGSSGWANIVRRGGGATLELSELPASGRELRLVVNARLVMAPKDLEERVKRSLERAAGDAVIEWEDLECFAPSPPKPLHRMTVRCQPGDDASCCASFYARPIVQYFLGDSYHPGGQRFTLEVAERLGLSDGGRVLDVACGEGTSLAAVVQSFPVSGVGIDIAPRGQPGERLHFQQGDAHAIPFSDGSFDAVICECALSTFTGQAVALSEMYRVLAPGGRLALSDMLVNGPIPKSLEEWVQVGTCLQRAVSLEEYAAMVRAAGFESVETWDATWTLRELLKTIKLKLLGAALAQRAGVLPIDVDIDVASGRQALRDAKAALDDEIIGYGALVAVKPR